MKKTSEINRNIPPQKLWEQYEREKSRIANAGLSSQQYQLAVRKLAERLGV